MEQIKVLELDYPSESAVPFNVLLTQCGILIGMARLDGRELKHFYPLSGKTMVFIDSQGRWVELALLPTGRAFRSILNVKQVWQVCGRQKFRELMKTPLEQRRRHLEEAAEALLPYYSAQRSA